MTEPRSESQPPYPTAAGTPCGHPWTVQDVTVGWCRLDQDHDGDHEVAVVG